MATTTAEASIGRSDERYRTTRIGERICALGGIAYVAFAIIGHEVLGSGGSSPGLNATGEDIANFFASTTSTKILLGGYIELLGLSAFVLFAGSLWSILRRAEGERGLSSTVVFGAGLLMVAIKFAGAAPWLAARYRAHEGLDPHVAMALYDINNASFVLTWFPLAILMLATAAVTIRTRVLPRWLGWTAVGLGVALLAAAPVMWISEAAFIPAGLSLLWIAATSLTLVRRAGVVRA